MAKGLKGFIASFITAALVGGGFCAPVFAQDIKPQPKQTQNAGSSSRCHELIHN